MDHLDGQLMAKKTAWHDTHFPSIILTIHTEKPQFVRVVLDNFVLQIISARGALRLPTTYDNHSIPSICPSHLKKPL